MFFQPRNKISGVKEASAECQTAQDCLKQWGALERSDERVRVEDEKGRNVSRLMLEALVKEEREKPSTGDDGE
ncbi:hypothetical protein [Loktanella salsilacus]|uniref:hypothetical protein n=1 Tax=Loktanella salsilacus TaxID=195913 RepID=UPI0020B8300B|nr:hypothetical protein [Loktanella salsilacus]UTH45325.1 hypothetical protein KBK07_04420 [Loktanella salsilacus]